mmetsp:Transcript_71593/g.190979  ORF Transcript_71593/g.190979 Transcript_71593/m.190979 type:complete len:389 (+) Transcript_71593:150-1316(+)
MDKTCPRDPRRGAVTPPLAEVGRTGWRLDPAERAEGTRLWLPLGSGTAGKKERTATLGRDCGAVDGRDAVAEPVPTPPLSHAAPWLSRSRIFTVSAERSLTSPHLSMLDLSCPSARSLSFKLSGAACVVSATSTLKNRSFVPRIWTGKSPPVRQDIQRSFGLIPWDKAAFLRSGESFRNCRSTPRKVSKSCTFARAIASICFATSISTCSTLEDSAFLEMSIFVARSARCRSTPSNWIWTLAEWSLNRFSSLAKSARPINVDLIGSTSFRSNCTAAEREEVSNFSENFSSKFATASTSSCFPAFLVVKLTVFTSRSSTFPLISTSESWVTFSLFVILVSTCPSCTWTELVKSVSRSKSRLCRSLWVVYHHRRYRAPALRSSSISSSWW